MTPRPTLAVLAALTALASAAPVQAQIGQRGGGRGGRPEEPSRPEPGPAAPRQVTPEAPPRTVEIRVTDKGFEPALVKAHLGERIRLVFTRETENTCAKTLVIDEFLVWNKLPLRDRFATTFRTGRTGQFPYTCPTREIQGIIEVEDAPAAK